MKIIFLDIDGVLNTSKTFEDIYFENKNTGVFRIEIDEFRVAFLKEIVDLTGANIVLTASMRGCLKKQNGVIVGINNQGQQLLEIFSKYNLEIFDITPTDKKSSRKNEILMWLHYNGDVESFLILDDEIGDLDIFIDNGLLHIRNNIEEFNANNNGLCGHHIDTAVSILNEKQEKNIKKV